MHNYATRILGECVAPELDMLLDSNGITENKLENVIRLTCLAKELFECDIMLRKLGLSDVEDPNPAYD